MKKVILPFFLSISFIFFGYRGYAEPLDFYCSGPISRMMGCAGIAGKGGYESAFLNPALISERKSLGIGYLFASQKPEITLRDQKLEKIGNPLENISDLNIGLSFSLADIPFLKKEKIFEHIGVGLAGVLPTSPQLIRVGNVMTKTPSTLLYGNRNTRFSIFAGLSGNIPIGENFKIFIGGSTFLLADLPILLSANLSPDKDLVVVDGALEGRPGFQGGIALTYSSESFYVKAGGTARSSIYINIPAVVDAYLIGEKALSLSASLFDSFIPSLFGAGIGGGYTTEKLGLHIALDFLRYNFSKFKLSLLSVDKVEPTEVANLLKPLLPKTEVSLQDINVIRLGVMEELNDLIGKTDVILGQGFSLFPSPLKNQQGTALVDADRTILSAGAGLRGPSPILFQGDIEFIISGQLHMLKKTEFDFPGIGKSSISGNLPVISAILNIYW